MTPAMRWVIAAVATAVVGGLVWAMVLGGPRVIDGADEADGAGGAAPSASPTQPAAEPTPVDGSEVLPPEQAQTVSGRLPALPAATPRIAAPLPANGTASGSLVAGYPVDLAGATPPSDVVDSSISGDGSTVQVSLTARTDETPDAVTAAFRERWAAQGLAPVAAADAALAYGDAFTSISLAVATTGTGTVYTVFATLRTE
ncbi:hypothetical protein N3K63_01635 [Microbacterium sp. W1N]|uniref:hypothetical protein n=1 Tax=Microbacterium festucae TaxID=2977531 RepID=UPI0021BE2E19|nr:hypothetical protein [Microbacterium festucae]MCT9818981.1 hypothetical protein [Microbacterium festucae]